MASSAPGRTTGLPWLAVLDTEGVTYQQASSTMTFTVTLSSASALPVSVDYRSIDNEPVPDDYIPVAGTLTFAPGETSRTIDITLVPDPAAIEYDETMWLTISNPVNATIYKGRGIGTIHWNGNPTPDQVNVVAANARDQCVKTVTSDRCVPLDGGTQYDIEEVVYIDPGRGKVDLRTTEGTMRFFGTRFGITKIGGSSSGTGKPVTQVVLRGGNFAACRSRTLAGARSSSGHAKVTPVRRLWGKGKGRFRTRGRYSSGTVRGTNWLTVDRCDGTRTVVRDGVVSVYDLVKKRSVEVTAGHSYLAKAPAAG